MEVFERLKQARIDAGYEHAQDAAEAFGWNPVTYRAHEAGDRGIRKPVAEKYARALRVPFEWLFLGRGTKNKEASDIIDIWDRIPDPQRDAARRMLEGLAEPKKTGFQHE